MSLSAISVCDTCYQLPARRVAPKPATQQYQVQLFSMMLGLYTYYESFPGEGGAGKGLERLEATQQKRECWQGVKPSPRSWSNFRPGFDDMQIRSPALHSLDLLPGDRWVPLTAWKARVSKLLAAVINMIILQQVVCHSSGLSREKYFAFDIEQGDTPESADSPGAHFWGMNTTKALCHASGMHCFFQAVCMRIRSSISTAGQLL